MLDQIGAEHVGLLGVGGPVAVKMLMSQIAKMKETIEKNEGFLRDQEKKNAHHAHQIEELRGKIFAMEGNVQTMTKDAEDRMKHADELLKTSLDAQEKRIEKRLDSLEGKIDKVYQAVWEHHTMQQSGASAPSAPAAPPAHHHHPAPPQGQGGTWQP